MDRPIVYSQEQGRTFDIDSLAKDAMLAAAWLAQDVLGSSTTVVSGAAPTALGTLTINISEARIYSLANADTNNFASGVLPADTRQIMQQGRYAASSVVLTTAGLTSGKSRWALVEAGFSQTDVIAPGDPNAGLLNFYNVADPTEPLIGPGDDGLTLPTVRQGLCVVKVVYGTVANTGSEVPPSAEAGYVGLYLIDLAFGQTVVNGGNILTAGPSVGTGVPSNYPVAPLLAGLLNAHHNGDPGQAPKINLAAAAEVTGLLPNANQQHGRQSYLSAVSTTWTVPAGVTTVFAKLWGAGGGGGGARDNGDFGAGAGAGEYREGFFSVTPGAVITITVGAKGVGGANTGGNGTDGGDTLLGTLVTAKGGLHGGGSAGAGISFAFGAGGSAGGGSASADSEAGDTGGIGAILTGYAGIMATGGTSFCGSWHTVYVPAGTASAGANGLFRGCGGGGAVIAAVSSGRAGGDGRDGTLIISW